MAWRGRPIRFQKFLTRLPPLSFCGHNFDTVRGSIVWRGVSIYLKSDVSAILILFIERQKEFGIYRSLGFSTGHVAVMTLMESLGMGLISFLMCTVTGTAVAFVLIKVINFYSFNWTIFYHHLWGPYAIAGVTALVASLGAALYPIFRISRTYPQMQIREE